MEHIHTALDYTSLMPAQVPLLDKQATAVTLPQGMIGFSGFKNFSLHPMALESPGPLWILQSVDEPMIRFILWAYHSATFPGNATVIAENDLHTICTHMNLDTADFQIFIILSAEHTDSHTRVYGNFRAPLLIYPEQQCAWQVILPNTSYPLRQLLEEVSCASQI